VLSPPNSSYQCPHCAILLDSPRSVDAHLRLDHVVDEDGSLTVAEILSASRAEPRAVPRPVEQRTATRKKSVLKGAQFLLARPWIVALLACVVMLYGLTHVGFGAGRLLLMWAFAVVAGAAVALASWGLVQLRKQPPPSH